MIITLDLDETPNDSMSELHAQMWTEEGDVSCGTMRCTVDDKSYTIGVNLNAPSVDLFQAAIRLLMRRA